MRTQVLLTVVLLVLASTNLSAGKDVAASADDIRFITSDAMKKRGLPFSELVEVDGWVYLSGSLGIDPETNKLVGGGVGPETRQTMENIKALLNGEGLDMERIVKCTVMLADMQEWPAFNKVYAGFFDNNYPARSAFGTSGLALNARVEIECMAKR